MVCDSTGKRGGKVKVTIAELEKKFWWWRHPNAAFAFDKKTTMTKRKPDAEFFMGLEPWKSGLEWAAWAWELARRTETTLGRLPQFIQLQNIDALGVKILFGKSEDYFTYVYKLNCSKPDPGYSHPVMWPLAMNDNALVREFKKFIASERADFGVSERKGSRQSEVSQGPRWGWVENLDLVRFGIRGKTALIHNQKDFNRTLAKARSRMRRYRKELEASNIAYLLR